MQDRTHDGRVFRLLTIVDEFTRECLSIRVQRKLTSEDVLEELTWLFVLRGAPNYIRPDACVPHDNGSEFTAKRVRQRLDTLRVATRGVAPATPKAWPQPAAFIEPGSPCENGCIESFNGKLRDELLDGEIFDTLREAQVLVGRWRKHYNGEALGFSVRPHSSLGYRPPAPEARQPWAPGFAPLSPPPRAA